MPSEHDPAVNSVRVMETPHFVAGEPLRFLTQVTFKVGRHGPFTFTYEKPEFTPERVQRDIAEQTRKLREIGALPTSGSDAA